MANNPKRLIIVDADTINGNLLIHFSTGKSVLCHAEFLWDMREHDGNVALPDDAAEADEAIDLPE